MRLPWILSAAGAVLLVLSLGLAQAAGKTPAIRRLPRSSVRGTLGWASRAQLQSAVFVGSRTVLISGILGDAYPSPAFVAGSADGGRHWQLRARLPGYLGWDLLTFCNPEQGWAVATPEPSGVPDQIFHTGDGGQHWTRVARVRGTVSSLVLAPGGGVWIGVEDTSSPSSFAGEVLNVGASGVRTVWTAPGPVLALARQGRAVLAEVGETAPGAVAVSIYRTTNHRPSWAKMGLVARYPAPMPAAVWLMSGGLVAAPGGQLVASVFALADCSTDGCGISGVYGSENGGATWAPRQKADISCQFAPVMASRGDTVLVQESVNLAACPGPGTRIFVSRDGGVHFVPMVQWAVGGGGLGFTPEGALWSLRGAALTVSGDQGRTWRQIFPRLTPTGGIAYGGPGVLYGLGDAADAASVLRSQDGGRSWQVVSSLGWRQAVAAAFVSPRRGFVAAIPEPGVVRLSPLLLRTTDGGRRWTRAFIPRSGQALFPVIRFFGEKRAVLLNLAADCPGVCPAGVRTDDAGRHWTLLPTARGPLTQAAAGAILSPRHFVLVTLGTRSRLGGIYATEDAGLRWHRLLRLPSRIQVFGPGLTFATAQTGYLVVNDVRRPVVKKPGKPFRPQVAVLALMKTTNGGRTWTLRDLPGLPAYGMASLAWQTARVGWLAIGGGVWKTTDGGARWTRVS
jgi:photosystem II stability/assembly factor-like uncharacterized protein